MESLPHRSQKGFTLIELMVVIAIIGMLSSVVLASLNTARKSGRDVRRLQDLRQISTALENYANDYRGNYPPHAGDQYGCDFTTCLSVLTDELVPNYIQSIPMDPIYGNDGNGGYRYCRLGTAQTQYTLLMWSEEEGGWCAVAHGANMIGTGCWFTDGVPQHGWCHEEM